MIAHIPQPEKAIHMSNGQLPPVDPDEFVYAMEMLRMAYRQGGEAAVRAILKGQNSPESEMPKLLAQLAGPRTTPELVLITTENAIHMAQNTASVITHFPEKFAGWRAALAARHQEWTAQGYTHKIIASYAGALLAILDGKEPDILAYGPYSKFVYEVIELIALHKSGKG